MFFLQKWICNTLPFGWVVAVELPRSEFVEAQEVGIMPPLLPCLIMFLFFFGNFSFFLDGGWGCWRGMIWQFLSVSLSILVLLFKCKYTQPDNSLMPWEKWECLPCGIIYSNIRSLRIWVNTKAKECSNFLHSFKLNISSAILECQHGAIIHHTWYDLNL